MKNSAVNMHAAKTNFSRLIARVERGERIAIARNGEVVAHLIPEAKLRRKNGPVDDPLLNLDGWAFDGPVGELTNAEIDRIVYDL